MSSVDTLIAIITARLQLEDGPVIVGIDGRSGAGKSTLAEQLGASLPRAVIEGDDFYAGGSGEQWDAMTPAERAAHCIDWRRQVLVLTSLRAGRAVQWHPYDWEAFDGSLSSVVVRCDPADVVVLEGVYSCRPELRGLVDVCALVHVPESQRLQQLRSREGDGYRSEWESRWSSAEGFYFASVMAPELFDVVIGPD